MALIRRCTPLFTKTLKLAPLTLQAQKIHRYVAPTLMELKIRETKQGGKVVKPRNTFLEWNLEAELYAFGKRLNEDFDSDLLLQAFTDRSYVIKEEMKQKEMEIDIKMKDSRELADEGKQITLEIVTLIKTLPFIHKADSPENEPESLEVALCEKFMKEYIQLYLEVVLPKFPLEGISGIKQHLLSDATLAHVSTHLGTKDIILASEYPVDTSILANTLKANVGALIQSSGEDSAAHFVRDFVITQLQGQDINEYWHIADPWSMLAGLLKKKGTVIEPRLIGEVGKNTLLACYRVGLYIDKRMISSGFGETVATAKEMAAREALKKIFGTEDHMKPINFQLQGVPKRVSQARYQISSS